jgi:hypothetical protein
MAIVLKVKWIDRSDQPEPHQRIRHIGGESRELRWKHTQSQAIESIERGLFAYYVEKDAHALVLRVGLTADGKKHLTLQAGGEQAHILFDLPGYPDTRHSGAKGQTAPPTGA